MFFDRNLQLFDWPIVGRFYDFQRLLVARRVGQILPSGNNVIIDSDLLEDGEKSRADSQSRT